MSDEKCLHVGPPRLLNYNCEVPSDSVGQRCCELTLELEDKTYHPSSCSNTVKLKLKASTLDTLLGSFDKIKQHLSSFDQNS